jgi:hypothetical protein
MKPYLLMTVLYLTLAIFALLDSAFASVGIVSWFNGLRWLRVHFITLGVVTQLVFGLAPALVALRTERPQPAMRWSRWVILNLGVVILLIGIPLVNAAIIATGGTLVFIATVMLVRQLIQMRAGHATRTVASGGQSARRFYLAALSYLLLGIFLGTGLWLGWGQALGLANPKEVHVHSNLWGFASLLFAGLIVDLVPGVTGRRIGGSKSIRAVFWLMTLGALGMVVGPWIRQEWVTSVGLVLHTIGTLLLLGLLVRPLVGDRQVWTPGMWHLVTAYVWFLIPAAVAPLIVANATDFPVGQVTSNGAPILIYGWIVQFGYALIPYLFARAFQPGVRPALGGSWFSLGAMHGGALLYWVGLFLPDMQMWLQAGAFGLWALALLPLVWELWHRVPVGVQVSGELASPMEAR